MAMAMQLLDTTRMLKWQILTVALLACAGVHVAAQDTPLWSATMTAESVTLDGDTTVGYWRLFIDVGELSDPDFDFGGSTYTVIGLIQDDQRSVHLAITPIPDDPIYSELLAYTLAVDDQRLFLGEHDHEAKFDDDDPPNWQLRWDDAEVRWSDGQRVEVSLTKPARVPALPLVGIGLLLVLLQALGWLVTSRAATAPRSTRAPAA
ncbi:MAG: hypothetical protein OXG35_14490 [Acidobacteria bacterium]|nr:hypothetical protein [Acidobacteriota bacterium]